jgi:hypothetical protein
VILEGSLTSPSGEPVTSAYIDVWLPVRDAAADSGFAGTVIQIAATSTTDDRGRYRVVLPATISQ